MMRLVAAASLSLIYSVSASVVLVPEQLVGPLQAKVQTEWRIVAVGAASDLDFAEALAVVPDEEMELSPARFAEVFQKVPKAQLCQLSQTGYDRMNLSAIPYDVTVCNVHNSGTAIPEYVIGGVLSWNVRLPQTNDAFRRCSFGSAAAPPQECSRPAAHKEARGQTLGVIGYGTLGEGVATRAAALGMRVVAVTEPLPAIKPAPLAWVGNDTMLPRLMREADFVVVTCPLLPSTTGLVSAEMLGYMKPSAVLINVARGAIVEEGALFHVLQHGSIGGAILDVWWTENWANMTGNWSRYNFSALPNVWMTPHTSFFTEEQQEEGIKQMAANVDALSRGEPLQNVVRNATAPLARGDVAHQLLAI